MRSEEARRLEESVAVGSSDHDGGSGGSGGGGGGGSSLWSRMGLQSSADGPKSGGRNSDLGEGDASSSGLMNKGGKRSKKRGGKNSKSGGEDSIYDDIDDDEEDPSQRYAAGHYAEHDDFLDQSLTDRHSPYPSGTAITLPVPSAVSSATVRRLAIAIHHPLYGDALPPSEMMRTLCLAMTLFFMIGGYWLLRSLKDPVLTALCGVAAIPKAKMLSVFVVLGVVSIYNRMLDTDIPKHRLFYIFGTFYFGLFTLIALLLSDPVLGLPNQTPNINRVLGLGLLLRD